MSLELVETVGRRADNTVTIDQNSDVPIDEQFKAQAHKFKSVVENALAENAVEKLCFLCKKGGANAKGFCRKCIESDVNFIVPHETKFDANFTDILDAPELKEIGVKVIEQFDEDFNSIKSAEILYLWKKKGGKSGGKLTLGKCKKPSGELKFFSEADFIVILGADNCEGLNRYQITALIYHELKHAGWNIEKGEYETISHDFEGFGREVEIFGDWKSDVGRMRRAFNRSEQLNLFSK